MTIFLGGLLRWQRLSLPVEIIDTLRAHRVTERTACASLAHNLSRLHVHVTVRKYKTCARCKLYTLDDVPSCQYRTQDRSRRHSTIHSDSKPPCMSPAGPPPPCRHAIFFSRLLSLVSLFHLSSNLCELRSVLDFRLFPFVQGKENPDGLVSPPVGRTRGRYASSSSSSARLCALHPNVGHRQDLCLGRPSGDQRAPTRAAFTYLKRWLCDLDGPLSVVRTAEVVIRFLGRVGHHEA